MVLVGFCCRQCQSTWTLITSHRLAVFIQNIFLSAPYGRNWSYLFASKHISGGAVSRLCHGVPGVCADVIVQVFGLIVLFFIVLWALILYYFSYLSTTHSWFLPLFAVGLLAPRWAQIVRTRRHAVLWKIY